MSGSLETIVHTMRARAKDGRVQAQGCQALAQLAEGERARERAVDTGGLVVLVAALRGHPRESDVLGWGARALAAHQNSMEAFPMLGVGAAIALGSGHDGAVAATLVWAWVAIRVAFIAAYVAGAGKLRTLTYSAALGCALALYTLPIIG